MRKPEQLLWDSLKRTMGTLWRIQRHEDKHSPDVPDLSYSCRRCSGWLELKVLDKWPASPTAPLDFALSHFTLSQRSWLRRHGEMGSGHCYLLAKIGDDFLLVRWSQLQHLGVWTRDEWARGAAGYWESHLDPHDLAGRISRPPSE
jgi:hypothetical protein